MSRALAVLGTALWVGAMAASPVPVLIAAATLAVASLWFQWRENTTLTMLVWTAAVGILAWGHGDLAIAGLGFLLQALGAVQAPGPRSVSLASWMLGLGTIVAVAAAVFWIPLRGSLLGSGSPLPLVLALAGIGSALAVLATRDQEARTEPGRP